MIADSAIDLYASRPDGAPHRLEARARPPPPPGGEDDQDRTCRRPSAASLTAPCRSMARRASRLDLPVGRIYQMRAARIYDGASEVHRMTIARELLKLAMQGESTKAATETSPDGPRDRGRRHRPHARGGRGQRAPAAPGPRPAARVPRRPRLGDGEPTIRPIGDGHLNAMYLLDRGGARFVLRRPPRPPIPPSANDMLREARVLRALKASACRGCWPFARTPRCSARRSTSWRRSGHVVTRRDAGWADYRLPNDRGRRTS